MPFSAAFVQDSQPVALFPVTRLGPYNVTARIGVGGIGPGSPLTPERGQGRILSLSVCRRDSEVKARHMGVSQGRVFGWALFP